MGSNAQVAPDLVSGSHSAGSVSFDTFPSPPEHFLQDTPGSLTLHSPPHPGQPFLQGPLYLLMEKVHQSSNAKVQALGVLTAIGCHHLQAVSVDRTRELSCQLLQRKKKHPQTVV